MRGANTCTSVYCVTSSSAIDELTMHAGYGNYSILGYQSDCHPLHMHAVWEYMHGSTIIIILDTKATPN